MGGGLNGGSGGGAAYPQGNPSANSPGSGVVGQGNSGGATAIQWSGAGGGGYSSAGFAGGNSGTFCNGGTGFQTAFSGTLVAYAGGGGGGGNSSEHAGDGYDGGGRGEGTTQQYNYNSYPGGMNGTTKGSSTPDAIPNTGGGGGGGSYWACNGGWCLGSGQGGSGIVIIKFMGPAAGVSYTWSSGGNTATTVVSPSVTTNYSIVVTSTSGCASATAALSVSVNPTPTISVNSGSICSGNNFTMIPSGANTYTFQGGNAIVSPTINASYTVAGTNTAGCISQSFATSNVTVNANPTITVNSGSICSGNSFTMTPSGANTYTFQGGNAIVSPTINASYTVAGTNTAGCVSQSFATSNLTVSASPTITANSGSICSGNSFTIVPSGANTYTFMGGGPVVTPSVNTSYSVSGTSSVGCTNSIAAVSNITVNALPTVSATSNLSLICLGESATLTANGANTYSWNTGGTNSGEVISPTVTTTYTVNGTDANGCSNTAIVTQSVDLCSGLAKQNFTEEKIQIYPNPNNGEFTVKGTQIEIMTIINDLGQVINTTELNRNNNYIANINNLPAGIYFICCKTARFKMIVLE